MDLSISVYLKFSILAPRGFMVLILSESDVASLLTMVEAVSVTEQVFCHYAQGKVVLPPRLCQDIAGTGGALRVVSAVLPTMSSFGVKTLTRYPGRRSPGETCFALLLFITKKRAHSPIRSVPNSMSMRVQFPVLRRPSAEVTS